MLHQSFSTLYFSGTSLSSHALSVVPRGQGGTMLAGRLRACLTPCVHQPCQHSDRHSNAAVCATNNKSSRIMCCACQLPLRRLSRESVFHYATVTLEKNSCTHIVTIFRSLLIQKNIRANQSINQAINQSLSGSMAHRKKQEHAHSTIKGDRPKETEKTIVQ